VALTLLNANPHKPVVALGQAYFAYQSRHQELVVQIPPSSHPEHVMQEALRFLLYTEDLKLQKAAQETRVVKPEDLALFFNHGYTGLISGVHEITKLEILILHLIHMICDLWIA
jgi:DNA-damage-inducible protein D